MLLGGLKNAVKAPNGLRFKPGSGDGCAMKKPIKPNAMASTTLVVLIACAVSGGWPADSCSFTYSSLAVEVNMTANIPAVTPLENLK